MAGPSYSCIKERLKGRLRTSGVAVVFYDIAYPVLSVSQPSESIVIKMVDAALGIRHIGDVVLKNC